MANVTRAENPLGAGRMPVAMEYDWAPTADSVRHLANATLIYYFTRPRELLGLATGLVLMVIAIVALVGRVPISGSLVAINFLLGGYLLFGWPIWTYTKLRKTWRSFRYGATYESGFGSQSLAFRSPKQLTERSYGAFTAVHVKYGAVFLIGRRKTAFMTFPFELLPPSRADWLRERIKHAQE